VVTPLPTAVPHALPTALSCLALAVLVAAGPGSAATARCAALWPTERRRRRLRPLTAGPTAVGALGGLLLAGPGGAVAGALVALTAHRRRRRRRAVDDAAAGAGELADAVSRMSEELRAGGHPAAVLAGVDADGPRARAVLAAAAVAARLGDAVPDALRREAARRPGLAADIDRIATAWAMAERYGVPLAELLAQAHRDIRWRVRFAGTVRAQLAGPRATALVLTALPVLGLALGQLVGADPVAVLRDGLLGQAMLVVGAGLAAAGAAWSERILQAAVPR
jgi:tight adherence protein B